MRPLATWSLVAVVALAFVPPGLEAAGAGPGMDKEISFGVKMAKRGLWNEALFRFKRAAEQRPNDAKILNNLAVAYEAVGQYDNALLAYKEALKADQTNRELKRNYSRFIEFYQAYKPAGEPAPEDQEAQQETTESSEPPSSPGGQ